METKRRYIIIDDNNPEIFDKRINRINQEIPLDIGRKPVYIVENRRKISKENNENVVEIPGVIKKHLHC